MGVVPLHFLKVLVLLVKVPRAPVLVNKVSCNLIAEKHLRVVYTPQIIRIKQKVSQIVQVLSQIMLVVDLAN